jgi:hypothetical protein
MLPHLLKRDLRHVGPAMPEMRHGDARHGIEVLFALDILEDCAVARLKHDQLPRAFLHERMPEAMHLVCFV